MTSLSEVIRTRRRSRGHWRSRTTTTRAAVRFVEAAKGEEGEEGEKDEAADPMAALTVVTTGAAAGWLALQLARRPARLARRELRRPPAEGTARGREVACVCGHVGGVSKSMCVNV